MRVIIDRNLVIPAHYNIFDSAAPTLIFTEKKPATKKNTEYIKTDFTNDIIPQILQILHAKKILSLIVEGGRQTLDSFISKNLWDEAIIQIGNKNFKKGLKAPSILNKSLSSEMIGQDQLIYYKNTSA